MTRSLTLSASILLSLGLQAGSALAEVNFEKQILPVLEKKCMSCHKEAYEDKGRLKKPKAGLRLDGDWAIMTGSENGAIVEIGKSAESYLHEVTVLPEDDDMFMPPKGDALTEDETKLLAAWIDEGAKFGGWKGNQEGRPADYKLPQEGGVSGHSSAPLKPKATVYDELMKDVTPASEGEVAKIAEAGGRVVPLAIDHPLARVDFIATSEKSGDDAVASLLAIKENVAQLDLARTQITDKSLESIGQLPRLVRLDLHSTGVADGGLQHLGGLDHLEYLNLYDTKVGDEGLEKLKSLKNLKSLYLWKSEVTEGGVKELQKALPDTKIVWR